MYKLFGIPNCDTVKKARTYLDSKKVSVEFVDFKKTTPSVEDVKRWAEKFGELPVNKKGVTYKKLKEEYEALADKDKLEFICRNSSLIKRPILEKNGKVVAFGFIEEDYKTAVS